MSRRAAAILVALVALVAVVETGSALTARSRVATDADWEAAAAEVRAGFQPGDVIAFAPAWVDQIGRAHLGDLVTVEMAGRSDADRYARVWEVSIRGAHAPDAKGAQLAHQSEHGRVRVALYDKPATPVVYDFTASAADARVLRGTQPCFGDPAHGWLCGGTRVERRTLEIDYRPRRGLLVPADRVATTLAYGEVSLGENLVVYAGMHDYYARLHGSGLVDFSVDVDGVEKLRTRIGNDDGWRRFDLDTRALAGTRHAVTFHVSAADPAWRNFGFHAEARR
ncbi:MAG TPA: hypothetical protein VN947_13230 [Polyangia bacterium]|nr:hypothetical protein [Polyangia bacterium]